MTASPAFHYTRMCLISLACLGAAPTLGWGHDGASGAANTGVDDGLRQAFERARYALEDSGHGVYRGDNPAQRLTLEFDAGGARLTHRLGSVSFHLTGYGYGEWLREPAQARLTGAGNRVEYQRGDLTEWYVNGRQGLEQGFTLARRPVVAGAGESLTIALGVSGSLAPRQAADGAVLFGAALRYAGLKAVDARGRVLPSGIEVRAGEIRLTVEDRDAEYPLTVDPAWTELQALAASDGAYDDHFGDSVAVSGNTAVIGATYKNGAQGAAYVFVCSGGGWSQQAELTASDGAADDEFGSSVSVSGNTAVIGAPNRTVGAPGQGAAYVFVRSSSGAWSQKAELTATGGGEDDNFGFSVSVSGNTAVIGASNHVVSGSSGPQGAAYVFYASAAGVWPAHQTYMLTASGGAVGDSFGFAVSVSGNTVVVGAPGRNNLKGAVYMFSLTSTGSTQAPELDDPNNVAGDNFGWSVSVSGGTAVIGAAGQNNSQGAAYAYVRNASGAWSLQAELMAPDGAANDEFGYSVSVSGNTAVVGAYGRNNGGAAYVFACSAGGWSQVQEIADPGSEAYDAFGSAVAVSGDAILIGAEYAGQLDGLAYVYGGPVLGASSLVVGSAAGTASILLTMPAGGVWIAESNDSFLQISPGSESGVGSAVVSFAYDAYSGNPPQVGTLTIAGLAVTVTQVGPNYLGPYPPSPITLWSSGLSDPFGLAVDGFGNVYIADTNNGAIKEWNAATQAVTTLVSSGLLYPGTVTLDGSGNVYIADTNHNAIKEYYVAPQMVTTLVSSGLSYPAGLATDGFGNLYIADSEHNAVKEWFAGTQTVTDLVSSNLPSPGGIAVDGSGNVYIAEKAAGVITEWNAASQTVTPLATSGLSNPYGLAVDGSGNVYIADAGLNAVYEWSPATGLMTPLATSGLNAPAGVAVDGWGNVYIADTYNSAIKELPFAFVGPATFTEAASSGSGSINVYPSTANLPTVLPPTPQSGQSWLTIGTVSNGVVKFNFTKNTGAHRTATISVLGQTVTVTQNGSQTQTINFTQLPAEPYGTTPTLTATASSSLPVSFNSQTQSVCTVSGAAVTLLGAPGTTCYIQATQAGNNDYAAATPVIMAFSVTLGSQTITFGALPNVTYSLNGTVTVSATATSGQTVTFSAPSGDANICSVSGTTVTLLGGGLCTIQATVAANNNYNSGSSSASFTITPASQTINFGALSSQVYGAAPLQMYATASSGLAVSFNATATPATCSVSLLSSVWTVTLANVGLCTIQATQAGNASYTAAPSVSQSFEVTQAGQTIAFLPLANVPFGTAPFAVSASSSSGLTVSFNSTTPTVCSVTPTGSAVTLNSVGVCGIQATQTGNANYAAATPVTQGFLVTQASQTITFVGPANQVFGATVPALSATTTAVGLTVSFASLTPGVCLVSGTSVTLVSVGTCYIQATQAGNANYAAATAVTQNFSVTQGSQTITFGTAPSPVYGGGPVQVSATATSGLPVSFTSTTPTVCTISGTMVTPVMAGPCDIHATQAGNANYAAATAVDQQFQVAQATQTITFAQPSSQYYGATFSPVATATSGLTVIFNAMNSAGICTASSSTSVALVGVGTCNLLATQGGNLNYYQPASPVSQSFQVIAASQTITFAPLSNKPFGSAPFTVSAQASSGLAVSFSSATPAVCTVSGSTVTLGAIGLCTIVASQPGNADYQQASPVSESFLSTGGTVTLAVVNSGATAGQSLQVPIQLTSTGTDSPSTFQADLGFDTTKLTFVSATAGTPLTNAGKTLSVNSLGSGSVRILAEGQNQTGISNGAAAYATFTLSAAFTTGSTTVTAGNCSASDGSGNALSVTCTAGTIRPMVCDINGDGNINVVDVQLEINEALGVAPALNDMNGDGVVNVVDVQIVINAALGLGCTY